MSKEEIEIRRLELDIEETKCYREEVEAQKRFEDRRTVINNERNDLDIQYMELDLADLKGKI